MIEPGAAGAGAGVHVVFISKTWSTGALWSANGSQSPAGFGLAPSGVQLYVGSAKHKSEYCSRQLLSSPLPCAFLFGQIQARTVLWPLGCC
jgi:hypothetical protein